eukprot:3005592-Rhodomonas_salina.2
MADSLTLSIQYPLKRIITCFLPDMVTGVKQPEDNVIRYTDDHDAGFGQCIGCRCILPSLFYTPYTPTSSSRPRSLFAPKGALLASLREQNERIPCLVRQPACRR